MGFRRESPGLPRGPRIPRLYSFSHLISNSISSLSALSRLWEEEAQKREQSHLRKWVHRTHTRSLGGCSRRQRLLALPSVPLRVTWGRAASAQGGTGPQALTCHHWGHSPVGGSAEPQGPGPFSLFRPGCRPPKALVSSPAGVRWAAPDSAGNPQHGAQTATPVPDGRGPPRAGLGLAGAVLPAPWPWLADVQEVRVLAGLCPLGRREGAVTGGGQ